MTGNGAGGGGPVAELVDGGWEPLLHLDDAHPTGTVTVGDHGTVSLDVSTLFG